MSFLCRVAALTLRERLGSSDIWRGLGVKPLLLRIKNSRLRWFGHLIRIPPWAPPLGGTSKWFETAGTCWKGLHIHSIWPGNPSGSNWRSWKMFGRRTSGVPYLAYSQEWMDGWMDVFKQHCQIHLILITLANKICITLVKWGITHTASSLVRSLIWPLLDSNNYSEATSESISICSVCTVWEKAFSTSSSMWLHFLIMLIGDPASWFKLTQKGAFQLTVISLSNWLTNG